MDLIIEKDGTARCIYDEAIHLAEIGQVDILRASHVEPTAEGQWTADMSPVSGPTLGPFSQRSQALDAEGAWLEAHWLTGIAFQ